MAANDELPRGLLLSSAPAVGVAASVTFPAAPGIAWVLTDVAAYIGTYGGASGAAGLPALGANGELLGFTGVPAVGDVNEVSWSGSLAFPSNTAVTVSWPSSGANTYEILTAMAYPV